MRRIAVAFWAVAMGLGMISISANAQLVAQSGTIKSQQSTQSSGIKVSIVSLILNEQKNIVLQVAIKNESNGRQYLFIAGNVQAMLSGGDRKELDHITGVPLCKNSYNDVDNIKGCLGGVARDIDFYSYIEPNEFVMAFLTYRGASKLIPGEAFHSVLKLVVRSSPPGGESLIEKGDTKSLTPPRVVTINFPPITF